MQRFRTEFLTAVGIVVVLLAALWLVSFSLNMIMRLLQTFAYWYQTSFMHYSWQFALSVGLLYLLYVAAIRHPHD